MRFLNRKLRRDIFRNWTQFFSVFLMALLSVLAYIGLEGVWYSMNSSVNTFIEESYLADSWVHASYFTEEDIDLIRNIYGVEEISVKTSIQVLAEVSDIDTNIILETPGTSNISTPLVISGENICSNLEGLWLNYEHASEHDLSIGEVINIRLHNLDIEIEVLGTIQSPTRMYFTAPGSLGPDHRLYGYGIISDRILDNVLPSLLPNLIEIRGAQNQVRNEAPDLLGERYISYFNQSTLFDVANAIDRPIVLRNVSLLYATIFLSLSILTMYTTIKRLIETQITDIATLKALGYSNKMIGFHYASYGLWVGGFGAIIGALGAPIISMFIFRTQESIFSVPNWQITYTWTSLLIIFMVISICIIAAILASRKARMGLPARFLRGNTIKSGKKIFLERMKGLWNKLKFGSRWTLRDSMSSPVRLLMGVVGVSGSMVLLMTGFGMSDSLDYLVENAFEIDITYAARIEVNPFNTPLENDSLQDELDGQWIKNLQANITSVDTANRVLTIFDDGEYIQLRTITNQRMQQNGVYLAEGFAQTVGLEVGDTLRMQVSMDTTEYEFEIVGIITPSAPQGIYIAAEVWKDAGGNFWPNELLTSQNIAIEELASDTRVEHITKMSDQMDSALYFVESLGGVIRLFIVVGIMLVIVILYNLGALNFTEKTRDYATLRVLGFHRIEIRKLAIKENIITTFIGWVLGIPLGYWFLGQYLDAFSLEGHVIFYPDLRIISLIVASTIAIFFSLTTTFLLGIRIKKVNMVEATKGVE